MRQMLRFPPCRRHPVARVREVHLLRVVDQREHFVDLLLVQRVLVDELGEPVAERAAGRRGVRDEANDDGVAHGGDPKEEV